MNITQNVVNNLTKIIQYEKKKESYETIENTIYLNSASYDEKSLNKTTA